MKRNEEIYLIRYDDGGDCGFIVYPEWKNSLIDHYDNIVMALHIVPKHHLNMFSWNEADMQVAFTIISKTFPLK